MFHLHNSKFSFFLFLNQNIRCWYSEQASHRDTKTHIKVDGLKLFTILRLKNLNSTYGILWAYHLCFLCLVFLMLLRLFIAALWSPVGNGLTSRLLLVMFIVFLLLSHEVSWVRCRTWLYRFLIFASFLTLPTNLERPTIHMLS